MPTELAALPPVQRFICIEHVGRPRAGQTRSHRVTLRDDDGRKVRAILKLRKPASGQASWGETSLAHEYAFAALARALGLNVPEFGVAVVGPIFANSVLNDAGPELIDNVGPNFASVELPHVSDWVPSHGGSSAVLRGAIEQVLSFDATVFNCDRKALNPNLLWDGSDQVHVIDHGLACPVHGWTPADVARSPEFPDGETQAHSGYAFLRGKSATFETIAARWQSTCTDAFWRELRAQIPPEWETRRGDLDRLFSFLADRSRRLQDITIALRRVVQ